MFLAGEGVTHDPELGLQWVEKAAAQGYPSAEYTMGVACQYGHAPGGLERAAVWFLSAAEAGEAKAQHEYGLALANGDGVEIDRREGAAWLEKAAAQGHKEATDDLAQARREYVASPMRSCVESIPLRPIVDAAHGNGGSKWRLL